MKYFHFIIVCLLFPFSRFKSYMWYIKHVDRDEISFDSDDIEVIKKILS